MSHDYLPDHFTSPGSTLLDKIEEMGLSQLDLSLQTGYSIKFINSLIEGKEIINEDVAIALEKVTNIPSNFWIKRELIYRERKEKFKNF